MPPAYWPLPWFVANTSCRNSIDSWLTTNSFFFEGLIYNFSFYPFSDLANSLFQSSQFETIGLWWFNWPLESGPGWFWSHPLPARNSMLRDMRYSKYNKRVKGHTERREDDVLTRQIRDDSLTIIVPSSDDAPIFYRRKRRLIQYLSHQPWNLQSQQFKNQYLDTRNDKKRRRNGGSSCLFSRRLAPTLCLVHRPQWCTKD